ncbi:MAG: FUSC family protein [Halioglobus sp.]
MGAVQPAQEEAADLAAAAPQNPRLRYAIKTALALMLAYMLPMALGWPQPQTAATTVMLIAATGMVSESLQKGVLRVIGTLIGAIVGLTLIALFPQDRMLYLACVSVLVALCIYLYNVYQGDSTVFMLSAVVIMMVFNGGDAEGAFIYGVDRAFMTVFGVLVYTIVASTVWPVKVADNSRQLAQAATTQLRAQFERLLHKDLPQEGADEDALAQLLVATDAFHEHLGKIRDDADSVKAYLPEWNTIAYCLEQIQAALVSASRPGVERQVEFRRFLDHYDELLKHLSRQFSAVGDAWQGDGAATIGPDVELGFRMEYLAQASHRTVAQVATRADAMESLQALLRQLAGAINSLLYDEGRFEAATARQGSPRFLWLDRESIKTGIRAFTTFWVATAIWIEFNPPMGFMFVTLCTALIPLVSYTPVTPKLLIILFSIGFAFAVPAYVFLLPLLTHWIELALFIFLYAFIGFFVFQGPISIFFLLGLFTLGIQNTMNYNVNVILLVVLSFYMVCAMQIISTTFPFTSNRARLFQTLRKRFFNNCATILIRKKRRLVNNEKRLNIGDALIAKMQTWGPMIDHGYYKEVSPEAIAKFTQACDLLQGQLKVAKIRNEQAKNNPLILRASRKSNDSFMSHLCTALAHDETAEPLLPIEDTSKVSVNVEKRLDEFLSSQDLAQYTTHELAQFYVYLNLQGMIYQSIVRCQQASAALNWQSLTAHRF